MCYVYQQARLVEYSYAINDSKEDLSLLIDRNNSLRYNIARLESPVRLDGEIEDRAAVSDYKPIDAYVIKVCDPVKAPDMIAGHGLQIKVPGIVLSMFSLNSEAIAKELSE